MSRSVSLSPLPLSLPLLPLWFVLSVLPLPAPTVATKDMDRLYADLLFAYNRLARPVPSHDDMVTVKMRLRLSQLIDVEWTDYQLAWDPAEYGNTTRLYVPSENIWLPDIVLYNNSADGNYEITINNTKAELSPSGRVSWRPPAIYKSYCQIDVEYFPFDEQNCIMKFGSWTYDDNNLDLRHAAHTNESELDSVVPYGVDLHDYYLSVEWDLMQVPAHRHKVYYNSCCKESRYIDISFNITMRRKTVFYTVNLIIPCVGISCLTILVFYLPSDSGEKVTLCISILLSLTVFFLLLAEIIPPTSLAVPLLGKYLLFTMVLVTLSVGCTICVLNIGYRSPSTHRLSSRARRVLLEWLPPLLLIRRPQRASPEPPLHELCEVESEAQAELEGAGVELPPLTVESDWRYVAMVLDRLFMWLFTVACTCGTCGILLQAPLLYDHTTPIDRIKSRVARANLSSMGDEDWQNREE
ncbi:Acetylcholine receptor subunit beta-like 2 [Amphibalanus amphitrite]|uniref:Acetylcholine receptor subunit beta-like 2 n=1 Tax=Amphibalanus amphitrite TaxID=1232801 RepID=A0A6A4X4Y9_AMPAM|nr:Acetylcholine receptor subunit beta-like 2 [Amphibalanus amphitrite]